MIFNKIRGDKRWSGLTRKGILGGGIGWRSLFCIFTARIPAIRPCACRLSAHDHVLHREAVPEQTTRGQHDGFCMFVTPSMIAFEVHNVRREGGMHKAGLLHFRRRDVHDKAAILCRLLGNVIVFWPTIFIPSYFVKHHEVVGARAKRLRPPSPHDTASPGAHLRPRGSLTSRSPRGPKQKRSLWPGYWGETSYVHNKIKCFT